MEVLKILASIFLESTCAPKENWFVEWVYFFKETKTNSHKNLYATTFIKIGEGLIWGVELVSFLDGLEQKWKYNNLSFLSFYLITPTNPYFPQCCMVSSLL